MSGASVMAGSGQVAIAVPIAAQKMSHPHHPLGLVTRSGSMLEGGPFGLSGGLKE